LNLGGVAQEKPIVESGPVTKETIDDTLEQALEHLWEQIIAQQERRPLKIFTWLETELAKHAMQQTGGNQVKAAKLLGISRNTLRQSLGL